MKITFKTILMAGTAVAAIGGAVLPATAQAQDFTLSQSDTIWASSAGSTGANIFNADPGQSVNLNGNILTVTDSYDGDAGTFPDDGSGVGTYILGAVTDTGTGDLIILQSAQALTVTVASAQVGDDLTITNSNAANAATVVNFTGATTVGGAYSIDNVEVDNNAGTLNVTHGGALTVTGATTIDGSNGGAAATATTAVTVNGNATFTGGVTVDGGTGAAGNTTTLTLNGATNNFGTGAVLDDNTGVARLIFGGSSAQTVTGSVSAATNGDSIIFVSNASGVTFNDDVGISGNGIGTVNVFATNGTNSSATFNGLVYASAMVLGNAGGTDTNTVTFSSSGTLEVGGTVDGDGAANDVAVVNIQGGGTIQQNGIWGGGNAIDLVAISGNSTLDSNAALTFTSATIASGSTLDVGAGNVAGNITNSGTIHQTGAGTITGDITGTGNLNIDATTTYTGNVAGTSADIATGATLNFAGANTYSVSNTTLNGTGTLALAAANQSITGNILAGADDTGAITIADGGVTHAFTGNIGTSTSQVNTLTVAGGGANIVTSTGNVYVNTVTMNGADTFQLLGTSPQTVFGVVNGPILLVGSAGGATSNVTFVSTLSLASARVFDGASATFEGDQVATGSDVAITGALTNDGTITINPGVDVVAGTYAADADAGTFNFMVSGSGGTNSIGKLWATGGALDLTNDNLVFMVSPTSGAITPGTITFASSQDAATATFTAGNVSDTSFLYNFSVAQNADTDLLDVTISQQDLATATGGGNNQIVANILLTDPTLQASTDANLLALIGSVQSASTQQEFQDALEQAQPTVDGSSYVTAVNVANTSFNMTSDRLAMLRTGEEVTGMTTGNVTQGVRGWTQAFGATGEQSRRDGIDGYDFDSYGVAVGLDTENLADNMVVGVAFSYADTDADSNNGSRTNTETDSYQFTIYGEHQFEQDVYLDGMVAYAHNNVETSRLVAGATARGEFDANQYTIRAEVGRDYGYETMTLTPHVVGHWTHYDPDGYTETGAGGAGQVVDQDSLNILELGIGATANWLFRNSDGSYFSPELNAEYRYDFAGDEVEMTSRFVAGGAAFTTEGFDSQNNTVDLGAGFTYFSTDNWELSAGYNYQWKEDFDSHSGIARAAYRF